jgi:hypothetical protein
MNRPNKLTSQQKAEEQQQAIGQQHSRQEAGIEFAGVEEMLRHDALHTPVPPAIARRLQQSIGPLPPRPWWRRLLGR